MNDTQLYQTILGIPGQWKVDSVELDAPAQSVTVHISLAPDATPVCPVCEKPATRYDHQTRTWRHLDSCQFITYLRCKIPRVKCDEHGVKQMRVPWAEEGSRFTMLFEAFAILVLKSTSKSKAAALLGITWDEADGIQHRAVRRGLARRSETKRDEKQTHRR